MRPATGTRFAAFFTVALLALVSSLAVGAADKLDGKAIFLSNKCNTCHSVPTAEITRTTKSEKVAGPDLVNITENAETLMAEPEVDGALVGGASLNAQGFIGIVRKAARIGTASKE